LSWREQRPDIQYIFSSDILAALKVKASDAFYVDKTDVYADDYLRIKAFGSTDIGISFAIEAGGKRIFHAGDFNNWHWNEESTDEEIRAAETSFLRKLNILSKAYPAFDLVLFPIDPRLGKDYMRGAEQFAGQIKINYFAPMHFGNNYSKASAFKRYAESKGVHFIEWKYKGQMVEIQ
jgi:L-ascorbate metabolism protein UlaG (beta-lactamase superfamily)